MTTTILNGSFQCNDGNALKNTTTLVRFKTGLANQSTTTLATVTVPNGNYTCSILASINIISNESTFDTMQVSQYSIYLINIARKTGSATSTSSTQISTVKNELEGTVHVDTNFNITVTGAATVTNTVNLNQAVRHSIGASIWSIAYEIKAIIPLSGMTLALS